MTIHYDISAEIIIHSVSGNLLTTNRMMFSWTDTVANLRASSQAVTLNIFFKHIRKQLFCTTEYASCSFYLAFPFLIVQRVSCTQAGREAHVGFQCVHYLHKANIRQTFPCCYGGTCITKYDACLAIHDLLCNLGDMPLRLRKAFFLQAWCKV
jgi:hypothetical protein